MKKLPWLSLAFCSLLACSKDEPPPAPAALPGAVPPLPAPAAAAPASEDLLGFEGEVSVLARSRNQKRQMAPITLQIKGDKVRFAVPEGAVAGKASIDKSAHVIVQPSQKRLALVQPQRKQVVQIDLEKLGDQLKSLAPSDKTAQQAEARAPELKKTGTMSEVAGRRCEEWEVTDADGEKARLCIARDRTSWFALPTIGLPAEHSWARELFDGAHLPLRAIDLDASGAEEGRIEVTKLEKKAIADATFEVPADFETIDLAAMLGGLMAGAFPKGVKLPPQLVGADGKVPPQVEEMMRKMMERAKAAEAKAKKAP